MFYNSCFADEITDFNKLGTGHRRQKIAVVDQNRHILFIARVFQNRCQTKGRVLFDNKRGVNLRSRTLGGQKVSLFLCTEDLEREWFWQSEIKKIMQWLEIARPEDVVVLAGTVAELSEMPKTQYPPCFACLAKHEIITRLPKLDLVHLKAVTSMLYSPCDRIAADEAI